MAECKSLKAQTQTMQVVEYGDLEEFITAHFGQDFSFPADQEAADAWYRFEVNGKFDAKAVEKFKTTGRGQWICKDLLNALAAEGVIKQGTYLIKGYY